MALIPVPAQRHAQAAGLLAGSTFKAIQERPTSTPLYSHPRYLQAALAIAYAATGYGARWAGTNNWGAPVLPGGCNALPGGIISAGGLTLTTGRTELVAGQPHCIGRAESEGDGAVWLHRGMALVEGPELMAAMQSGLVEDLWNALGPPISPVNAADLAAAVKAISAATGAPILWTSASTPGPLPGPGIPPPGDIGPPGGAVPPGPAPGVPPPPPAGTVSPGKVAAVGAAIVVGGLLLWSYMGDR